jgi:hypothetical protein
MLRVLSLTGGIGEKAASFTLMLLFKDAVGDRVLTSVMSA